MLWVAMAVGLSISAHSGPAEPAVGWLNHSLKLRRCCAAGYCCCCGRRWEAAASSPLVPVPLALPPAACSVLRQLPAFSPARASAAAPAAAGEPHPG